MWKGWWAGSGPDGGFASEANVLPGGTPPLGTLPLKVKYLVSSGMLMVMRRVWRKMSRREGDGSWYCCTRSGVGTVMMYSWLMDCRLCGLILKNALEEEKSRGVGEIHIYTRARRRVTANAALQTTGQTQANPLTHALIYHWVEGFCELP